MMAATATPACREAHEATYEALIRIAGLTDALYHLAPGHAGLSTDDPDNNAILSLIAVLEEKAEVASKRHAVEWDAAHGKATPC